MFWIGIIVGIGVGVLVLLVFIWWTFGKNNNR